MDGKTELIFKINGKHYWEEIRDTIHRIVNEFGGKHVVKIEVEKLPCFTDEPLEVNYPSAAVIEKASFTPISSVPNWENRLVKFNLTQPQEQTR